MTRFVASFSSPPSVFDVAVAVVAVVVVVVLGWGNVKAVHYLGSCRGHRAACGVSSPLVCVETNTYLEKKHHPSIDTSYDD